MNFKKLLVLSLVIILVGTIALGCGGPDEDYDEVIEEGEENGGAAEEGNGGGMEEPGETEEPGGGDADL
ncbi:MAG: hypothetical protein ACOCQS_00450 [Bacillota bacterium]